MFEQDSLLIPPLWISWMSANGGCGKTLGATYAAVTAAETMGLKTVIVDGDLATPTVQQVLAHDTVPDYTLNDFIDDKGDISPTDILIPTEWRNLWAIYASENIQLGMGTLSIEPVRGEIILSRLRQLKSALLRDFDLVIMDNPAGISIWNTNVIIFSDVMIFAIRPRRAIKTILQICKKILVPARGIENTSQKPSFVLLNLLPKRPSEEVSALCIEIINPLKEFNIQVMGQVPCLCHTPIQSLCGRPLFEELHNHWPIEHHLRTIFQSIDKEEIGGL